MGEFSLIAPAVVVTTGGIGADHDLVRRYWPERLGTPPASMVTGVPAYGDARMLELQARGMTKKDLIEFLMNHGWRSLSNRDGGCWIHFEKGSREGGDRNSYTIGQAIRAALLTDPPDPD